MLNRCGAQRFANRGKIGLALFALIAEHADFDQFVVLETALDFFHDSVGQAVLADNDDRVEIVGAGAQGASLSSGDFEHVWNFIDGVKTVF